ncbi:hypothetical protein WJX72_002326 [[Myrmecia] bisecta]|uniref:Kelch repeat-containing protein n=1 Tax=[Myrmecia] bisecta TaxID=41462 RepID=A0AAW1QPG3_9CHLO
MGKGRDKRKKATGKVAGKGAEKTEKKTVQNQLKAQRRSEKQAEGGDADLDALLAKFKMADEALSTVLVEENVSPPSARVHATFTPVSAGKASGSILLFGGEWYDGKKDQTHTYSDFYAFNPEKQTWQQIKIPKSPPPRNAHQAVVHKKYLYVCMGELTSLNQEKFKHYRDLWRLNLEEYEWEQLPARGGPSPRSGHRMAVYKNKLILFGGFHDDGNDRSPPTYFNDLWEFDMDELKWTAVDHKSPIWPSPRSGCPLVIQGDMLYLFGGYARTQDEDGTELETVHEDVWALNLLNYQWERIKKAGMAPGRRTQFGLVVHNTRAILFGGISDQAGAGDRLYSETHGDLYQFNLESRRWYPLGLRPPKQASSKHKEAGPSAGPAATQVDEADAQAELAGAEAAEARAVMRPDMTDFLQKGHIAKDSPIFRAALRIQSRYRGYVVRKAYKTYKLGGQVSELLYSPATYGVDFSAKDMPRPRGRASPLMAVQGKMLWLYGGSVEIAHTDITLDDIWCVDLNKLNGWRCIKPHSGGEDAFKDDEWETDDGEDNSDNE